jgi:hypothetical protein
MADVTYICICLYNWLGFPIHILLCNCDCTLLLVICTKYFKQFEVLTKVIVKITVLEDVVLCSLVASYHYFRRSLCRHVQGRTALPTRRVRWQAPLKYWCPSTKPYLSHPGSLWCLNCMFENLILRYWLSFWAVPLSHVTCCCGLSN